MKLETILYSIIGVLILALIVMVIVHFTHTPDCDMQIKSAVDAKECLPYKFSAGTYTGDFIAGGAVEPVVNFMFLVNAVLAVQDGTCTGSAPFFGSTKPIKYIDELFDYIYTSKDDAIKVAGSKFSVLAIHTDQLQRDIEVNQKSLDMLRSLVKRYVLDELELTSLIGPNFDTNLTKFALRLKGINSTDAVTTVYVVVNPDFVTFKPTNHMGKSLNFTVFKQALVASPPNTNTI